MDSCILVSACTQSDRDAFSTEAIELMSEEFQRSKGQPQRQQQQEQTVTTSFGEHKKEVVDWKFQQLDENGYEEELRHELNDEWMWG